MVNPEDIDDCMQSRYLKVWKQLQKQPDLFAEKPKKYVVQAIVMRSKAQRYDADPLKLFALYSLTTSVKMKDVQSVAHADKNQLIQARNAVKNDLM